MIDDKTAASITHIEPENDNQVLRQNEDVVENEEELPGVKYSMQLIH